MNKLEDTSTNGGGFVTDILSLGLPIGLGITANKLGLGNIKDKKKPKDQEGGFLEKNLILEAGLSVVPFALIGAIEYLNGDKSKETKSNKKKLIKQDLIINK